MWTESKRQEAKYKSSWLIDKCDIVSDSDSLSECESITENQLMPNVNQSVTVFSTQMKV